MDEQNSHAKRILLVEDQAILALAEKQRIEKHGYRVTTAHSGERAIAAMDGEGAFDLILMDIDLGPGIRGTEAARRILSRHHIPIVFLSSHTEREVVDEVKGITRYGYVLKSAGEFVLLEAITMAFELFETNRKLEEITERYRWIEENTSDGVAVVEGEEISYLSPSYERLLGYERGSAAGMRPETLLSGVPPEDKERLANRRAAALDSGTPEFTCLYRYRRPDNTVVWIEDRVRAFYDDQGRHLRSFVNGRDVTERMEMQEELESRSEEADRFFSLSLDLFCIADQNGRFVKVNRAWEEFLGLPAEELRGRPYTDFMHPDDVNSTDAAATTLKEQGKLEGFVNRYRRHDGEYRYLEWRSTPSEELVYAAARDVTERVEREEELADKMELFRELFEEHPTPKLLIDPFEGGRIVDANSAAQSFYGVPKEEMTRRTVFAFNTASPEYVRRCMSQVVHKERQGFDFGHRRADGTLCYVHVASSPVQIGGKTLLYSVVHDITDRLEAQRAVTDREELLRGLVEHANTGIVLTDEAGYVAEWNGAQERISGVTREEVLGMPVWEAQALLYGLDDGATEALRGRFRELLDRGFENGGDERRITFRTREGEKHLIQSAFSIATARGHRLASLTQDMTALIESEQQYRLLAENSRDVIALLGADLGVKYISPSVASMTGYDSGYFESHDPFELLHPEDKERAVAELRRNIDCRIEHDESRFRVRKKGGREIWVEAKSKLTFSEQHGLESVLLNLRDITPRVQVETALQRRNAEAEELLEEKELLMREIQHRVKNVMSTMVSLLSLQASALDDPGAVSALEDSAHKFRSMWTLFDQLYLRPDSGEVVLAPFLRSLVEEIVGFYPQGERVSSRIDCEDIVLPSGTVATLGILVTEIFTNSLTYAFSTGQPGTVSVTVREGDGQVVLDVADDGKGLPEGVQPGAQDGFGMGLIEALVDQINGSLQLEREGGTRYRITFPSGSARSYVNGHESSESKERDKRDKRDD